MHLNCLALRMAFLASSRNWPGTLPRTQVALNRDFETIETGSFKRVPGWKKAVLLSPRMVSCAVGRGASQACAGRS
jgi:hypothetical protein